MCLNIINKQFAAQAERHSELQPCCVDDQTSVEHSERSYLSCSVYRPILSLNDPAKERKKNSICLTVFLKKNLL